jgi:pyridoxine 5-phosphate synthase
VSGAVKRLRLGVNIDHVATIRNARGGRHPDPVRAALISARAGADNITAHLRADRRHIAESDIERLQAEIRIPLNLEMAPTEEMLAIALKYRPQACCLVPERPNERTTQGGLDVRAQARTLAPIVRSLGKVGVKVSIFVEPSLAQLAAARELAPAVELHTGRYCEAEGEARKAELARLRDAAAYAEEAGLECHAGHGLGFDTVEPIAQIAAIEELNIGHFLIGEAIFSGLDSAIKRMRALMDRSRALLGQHSA